MIDKMFNEKNISEFGQAHRLTLGELRKFINACTLPDDTSILYENISEKLLTAVPSGGWDVTPMLWEIDRYGGAYYSPCI